MGFFVLTALFLLVGVIGLVGGRIAASEAARVAEKSGRTNNSAAGLIGVAVFIGALLLIVVITVFKTFHTVDNGHIGIVKQFGQVVGTTSDGLVTTAPWQNIDEVSIKREIRRYNMTASGENQIGAAVSSDSQPIFIELVVDFSLDRSKAVELYKETGGEFVQRLLDPAVPQLTKEVTSQYKATDVAGKRAEIRTKIVEALSHEMNKQGITINTVNIPQFSPTAELAKSIEGTVVAGQNAKQAQAQVAVKEAEARQVAAAAKGQADAVVLAAQAEAQSINLKGRALRNNPDLLKLEAINKLNPNVQVMYLPSDATVVQGIPQGAVVPSP